MIKVKISYIDQKDKKRIIEALKGFKIIRKSKEYDKKNSKNMYLEIE